MKSYMFVFSARKGGLQHHKFRCDDNRRARKHVKESMADNSIERGRLYRVRASQDKLHINYRGKKITKKPKEWKVVSCWVAL